MQSKRLKIGKLKKNKQNKAQPWTYRYEVFCDAYIRLNNATQAAIKAGYSPKTAYSQGQRLLKNVEVKKILADIRRRFDEISCRTREKWLRELESVAFSRMKDVAKWGPGYVEVLDCESVSERAHAAVAKVTENTTTIITKDGAEITRSKISVDLHDKLSALIKYGTARGFMKGDGQGAAINGAGGSSQDPLIGQAVIIIPGKMDMEEWQKMAERELNRN